MPQALERSKGSCNTDLAKAPLAEDLVSKTLKILPGASGCDALNATTMEPCRVSCWFGSRFDTLLIVSKSHTFETTSGSAPVREARELRLGTATHVLFVP